MVVEIPNCFRRLSLIGILDSVLIFTPNKSSIFFTTRAYKTIAMKVYKEKKREFIVKIVSIMKTIRFAMNKSFCLRTKK